jgi:hypothetical protein
MATKGRWFDYWDRRRATRGGDVTYTKGKTVVARGKCADTDRGRNWVWSLSEPVVVKGHNVTRAEAYDSMGNALMDHFLAAVVEGEPRHAS